MSPEPIRLLEGLDASDAERSLLATGRSSAPVEYDVVAGAARFRTQLAALAAAGAVTAGAGAAGPGVAIRGKALLAKVAFKVVLGLMAGGAFAGAGVLAGMHMARTSAPGETVPAPPKAEPVVAAPPAMHVVSSAEPISTPPAVVSTVASPEVHAPGAAPRAAREARHPGSATAHASGSSTTAAGPASHDAVDETPGALPVEPAAAASVAEPPPRVAQPPQPPQPPAAAERPAPQKPVELSNEVRAVALARSLVERDPEAALELLEKTRREHPNGYFVEERQALTVLALVRSGRQAAAHEQAAAFLRTYPNGPFSDRVRAVAGP
jgi:hypothetical protein